MRRHRPSLGIAALIAVGGVSPGWAQTTISAAGASQIAQGATIYDTAGGTVGTIESVSDGFAIVSTASGKSRAQLPLASFGKGDKGPVLAMTAAELDAATAAATPAASSAPPVATPQVAAGTIVSDASGGKVGTIESIDGAFAILATSASKVRLPLTSFANGPNGPMIGMTAAQLDQAAAAANPNGG